jgi:hypothetical protein
MKSNDDYDYLFKIVLIGKYIYISNKVIRVLVNQTYSLGLLGTSLIWNLRPLLE